MARDKSVVAVVILFLTLGVGGLVGWTLRGAADSGPTDQVISAAKLPAADGSQADTSILLPRSAVTGDRVEGATSVPPSSLADGASDVAAEPDVEAEPDMEAGADAAPEPDATENQTAPASTSANTDDESRDTAAAIGATTTAATAPTSTQPETRSPTTTASPQTTTTAAPTTTATTTLLTDPSFSSVQFQSPIACVDGGAVSQVSWETIDASAVSILINGVTIAADLPPGGVFDADFSCAADGVHDVELVATGISSDPARAAFTSSVTDQITTEG